MNLDFSKTTSGRFISYRNIATCSPSQDLFDDIADHEDFDILQLIDNESSGIDHTKPKSMRPQQYGHIFDSLLCFDEPFWAINRFGDGNMGVWYGAADELTSQMETLYHRPEIDKNDLLNAFSPIIQDRRMFVADLASNSIFDLTPHIKSFPDIVNPNDYKFCQSLGRNAKKEDIDMFLTPSVRNKGGICHPVFKPEIISDSVLYDYVNKFPIDGSEPIILRSIDPPPSTIT